MNCPRCKHGSTRLDEGFCCGNCFATFLADGATASAEPLVREVTAGCFEVRRRVGVDRGAVVMLDERFRAYHESFYRFVEATSVTPFSAPALDRGLAAVLVAMTRLGDPALTPPDAVKRIADIQERGVAMLRQIAKRAAEEQAGRAEADQARIAEEIERIGHSNGRGSSHVRVLCWKTARTKDVPAPPIDVERGNSGTSLQRYGDGTSEPVARSQADLREPLARL